MSLEEKIYEVTPNALAYGGEALGRLPDGRAVFVPFALPGERVRAQLVEEKQGYARARLIDVLEPSARRIAPRCPYFTVCGGCHYQHMPYEYQLEIKAFILRDQLQRIGRFTDPPLEPAVPSPQPWYYRNHVQFHLSPEGKLGFLAAGSPQVVPVAECHLPETVINDVWPLLDMEPVPGIERVAFRSGLDGDLLLALESTGLQVPELSVEDLPVSAVFLAPEQTIVMAGSGYVEIEVLGRTFRVSAGSFFQVNTLMAERMVQYLLEHLVLDRQMTILEIYCGAGLFSAFLAPRVGRLVGVEASSSACEDFEENLAEFDHVELYEAVAEVVLPTVDYRPDILLVDPPRAGLGRPVLDEILRMRAPRLVYISCDPATLARDGRRLAEGGYHLEKITPFDLFPQTYHIESISFWVFKNPS